MEIFTIKFLLNQQQRNRFNILKMLTIFIIIFPLLIFQNNNVDANSDRTECRNIECPPPEIVEICPADSVLVEKFEDINPTESVITTTKATPRPTIKLSPFPEEAAETTKMGEKLTNDLLIEKQTVSNIPTTKLYRRNRKKFLIEKSESSTPTSTTTISTTTSLTTTSSTTTSPATTTTSPSTTTTSPSISTNGTSPSDVTKKLFQNDTEAITSTETSTTNAKTNTAAVSTKLFEILSTSADKTHKLKKRSLRYHSHESIKIVPTDFRNLEPWFSHINLRNRKWKREAKIQAALNPLAALIKQCCPKKMCACKEQFCSLPVCVNPNQILIQTYPGSNVPGKCCPEYSCVDDEPRCSKDVKSNEIFWPGKCQMCQCIHGTKLCHNSCPEKEPTQCFSASLKRVFKEGDNWKEDDCTHCECMDGKEDCQVSVCRILYCKKQVKFEGMCCPICEEDITTTTNPSVYNTESTTLMTCLPISTTSSSSILSRPEHITEIIVDHHVAILSAFICILFIGCIIFMSLYIRELRKRPTYSSIPNSDSDSNANNPTAINSNSNNLNRKPSLKSNGDPEPK